MAAAIPTKPFSPEEAQRIVHHLQQPAVFLDMTGGWPVLHWTLEYLSRRLGDRLIRFRVAKKEQTNAPLFETQCSYVEARMVHFLSWTRGQSDVGPFAEFPFSEFWAYADYKYIAVLFQDQPAMFEDVKWSDFGFEGRNGRESTLWIGTKGANTPCHMDSYGCNLVLQVQGRKRWFLFPPSDTANLYPTRIPYEESSIFSQVDVLHPDLNRFPAFQAARPHIVTLQPGQVLYVPRHWWHYVESVDPITVSVNSWIDSEVDDIARVTEAVTKTIVWAVKGAEGEKTENWLNPTEDGDVSHHENMAFLNLALSVRGRKRDPTGQIKSCDGFAAPFGVHLLPVSPQQETFTNRPVSAPRRDAPTDLSINTNDLLNCLLHPDIIDRICQLLLQSHHNKCLHLK